MKTACIRSRQARSRIALPAHPTRVRVRSQKRSRAASKRSTFPDQNVTVKAKGCTATRELPSRKSSSVETSYPIIVISRALDLYLLLGARQHTVISDENLYERKGIGVILRLSVGKSMISIFICSLKVLILCTVYGLNLAQESKIVCTIRLKHPMEPT